MSIFVIHSTHELHQLKKALLLLRGDMTTYQYDLQNESDEQFTDMKVMFSRYELKTITKRLVRGRNQSASEGKFLGSVAPYGYRAYKLVGMKGNMMLE